jgi:CO/xanthine dehydrogenase FAD-binding subunit
MDIDTISEIAVAPGATWRSGDAWLAGGTWLYSEPQPDLRRLLDLQAFGWPSLTVDPFGLDGGGLEIGATCTIAELVRFAPPADWTAAPLLRQCCESLLGSFKVWNMATVGGNICLGLPAGPMTSLTASLDGVCSIWLPDGSQRTMSVVDFVTGAGETALAAGELLRSITIPADTLRQRTAFRQLSLSPVGRSAVVVIGRRSPVDSSVVVTVTASTPRPVQLRFLSMPSQATALTLLEESVEAYHDDVHGKPAWREAMTHRFVAEVLDELRSDEFSV